MNVSRVALAIDCDVGAYRRASCVEQSHPADAHSGIRTFLEASWNVMAHAQKTDFVFRRNGRVHLNRRGRQFSRLLAVEVCASAVVMLDTPCSEVVWRVLTTHSIRQFPLHCPSRASPRAITCQLETTTFTRYYLGSFTHTHTHIHTHTKPVVVPPLV
jgi:hypothetical protein